MRRYVYQVNFKFIRGLENQSCGVITNLHQGIVQGEEHIEYLVSGLILCREETITLEESLINIFRKMGNIEYKLLLINDHVFLMLYGQVLSFLDKRSQHL